MHSHISIWVYCFMQMLIFGQLIASHCDKYLSQSQLKKAGKVGHSLVDHGGIWFDAIIISYLIAGITGKYNLNYFSWYGILSLVIIFVIAMVLGRGYSNAAKRFGEAHTHDGKTTVAGWLHGIYAIFAIWVVALLYLTPTTPQLDKNDLLFVAIVLTPFFPFGAVKFNRYWFFDTAAIIQSIAGPAIIWIITDVKIWLLRVQ